MFDVVMCLHSYSCCIVSVSGCDWYMLGSERQAMFHSAYLLEYRVLQLKDSVSVCTSDICVMPMNR